MDNHIFFRKSLYYYSENLLHDACKEENILFVKELIQQGFDVSKYNSIGLTPLLIASEKGNIEIIKLLLKNKASLSEKNICGWNSLFISVYNQKCKLVKWLLSTKNINILEKDEEKRTPLHYSAFLGNLEITNILISYGLTSQSDIYGYTPLLTAGLRNKIDIVIFLLEEKISKISEKTNEGHTIWDLLSRISDLQLLLVYEDPPTNSTFYSKYPNLVIHGRKIRKKLLEWKKQKLNILNLQLKVFPVDIISIIYNMSNPNPEEIWNLFG